MEMVVSSVVLFDFITAFFSIVGYEYICHGIRACKPSKPTTVQRVVHQDLSYC